MTAVPPELLRKYGTQGPRYTSYPTAPNFAADVDRAALGEAWRQSTADLSLYVHVPFCQVRCTFCGCHVKITQDRERATPYVDRVLAELDRAGEMVDLRRPLRQVQLGGGTPNFLPPDEMARLVDGLRVRLRPAADAEWAIECDPRHLDAAYVERLLALGFNRFSFGVQDLDPDVMAAVNRPQALADLETVVAAVRSHGAVPPRSAVPLNLDLIHGLPKQTPESWARTLDAIIALRPERSAVFGYAHVPWLKPHQRALELKGLPDAALRATLAAQARDAFTGAGYVEIGMDHYALPDDELAHALRDGTLHRNFQGYTTKRGLDLLALGTSGISRVGASYAQDHKDLARWADDVDGGRMPWERGLLLSPDDLLRGDVITELSCNGRLDFARIEAARGVRFADYFARELEALDEMQRDGLLVLGDADVRLTPLGRYLVRNVCMTFDAWLPRDVSTSPRFSSTV